MKKFTKKISQRIEKFHLEKRINNAKTRIFQRHTLVHIANTPFDVIYDDGLAKLRHYPALKQNLQTKPTPILLVSPLAVTTAIYDLLEHRSFIRFLLQQGFDVYLVDWGVPSWAQHSEHGFNYYVAEAIPAMIKAVREYSGQQKISLHGWSMGGVFSMLYCAYSQDKDIKNLILVGTPVDGHASGYIGFLCSLADAIYNKTEMFFNIHPRQLPNKFLHSKGILNVLGFKAVDPIGTLKGYLKLLRDLGDEEALKENATKHQFLLTMSDYPGAIVKDMAIHFWIENRVLKGTYYLNNKLIDLKNITSNLLVISGNNDMLVTTQSALPILDICHSNDKTHIEITGGHVGIVSSKKTSNDVWPKIAKWLTERS